LNDVSEIKNTNPQITFVAVGGRIKDTKGYITNCSQSMSANLLLHKNLEFFFPCRMVLLQPFEENNKSTYEYKGLWKIVHQKSVTINSANEIINDDEDYYSHDEDENDENSNSDPEHRPCEEDDENNKCEGEDRFRAYLYKCKPFKIQRWEHGEFEKVKKELLHLLSK